MALVLSAALLLPLVASLAANKSAAPSPPLMIVHCINFEWVTETPPLGNSDEYDYGKCREEGTGRVLILEVVERVYVHYASLVLACAPVACNPETEYRQLGKRHPDYCCGVSSSKEPTYHVSRTLNETAPTVQREYMGKDSPTSGCAVEDFMADALAISGESNEDWDVIEYLAPSGLVAIAGFVAIALLLSLLQRELYLMGTRLGAVGPMGLMRRRIMALPSSAEIRSRTPTHRQGYRAPMNVFLLAAAMLTLPVNGLIIQCHKFDFVMEDGSKYQRTAPTTADLVAHPFNRTNDVFDLSADREVDYEFGQCKGDDGKWFYLSSLTEIYPAGSSVRMEVEVDAFVANDTRYADAPQAPGYHSPSVRVYKVVRTLSVTPRARGGGRRQLVSTADVNTKLRVLVLNLAYVPDGNVPGEYQHVSTRGGVCVSTKAARRWTARTRRPTTTRSFSRTPSLLPTACA